MLGNVLPCWQMRDKVTKLCWECCFWDAKHFWLRTVDLKDWSVPMNSSFSVYPRDRCGNKRRSCTSQMGFFNATVHSHNNTWTNRTRYGLWTCASQVSSISCCAEQIKILQACSWTRLQPWQVLQNYMHWVIPLWFSGIRLPILATRSWASLNSFSSCLQASASTSSCLYSSSLLSRYLERLPRRRQFLLNHLQAWLFGDECCHALAEHCVTFLYTYMFLITGRHELMVYCMCLCRTSMRSHARFFCWLIVCCCSFRCILVHLWSFSTLSK